MDGGQAAKLSEVSVIVPPWDDRLVELLPARLLAGYVAAQFAAAPDVTQSSEITGPSSWWPLVLSRPERAALEAFRTELRSRPIALDRALLDEVDHGLCALMEPHVRDIVDRDGLPHLAHLIIGWGDAVLDGHRLSERLVNFVYRDESGRPHVLQRHTEGEFHPWQSFAYLVMAGVDADEPIGSAGVTLRELAANSRYLHTADGSELGHLLFALAHLEPHLDATPFSLLGATAQVEDLMDVAVIAHQSGHFRVCRKFHLTQGLCAMAVKVPELRGYRPIAARFLHGQLEMLLLLALLVSEAAAPRSAPASRALVERLRALLVIEDYLENHCFYAGHLLELACYTELLGYARGAEYASAMILVANELNRVLRSSLPLIDVPEAFLHLGHYRRGITLLRGDDLSAFTASFDAPSRAASVGHSTRQPVGYRLAPPSPRHTRERFERIISGYAQMAQPGLDPRGGFPHFRRIIPPGWPRALHYEFLDYGNRVGAEIHLESDAVRALAPVLRTFQSSVRSERPIEWDPNWWGNRGRLRVLLDDDLPSDAVVNEMRCLIDVTIEPLTRSLATLVCGAEPSGLPR